MIGILDTMKYIYYPLYIIVLFFLASTFAEATDSFSIVPNECQESGTYTDCGLPALATLVTNIASFLIILIVIIFVFVLIRIGFGILSKGESSQGRWSEVKRARGVLLGLALALLAFPIVYFAFQTLGFWQNDGDPFYIDEGLNISSYSIERKIV